MIRGRWCHIIVLNVHVPTEDKTEDVKDSFYEELERVFDKFPKCHMRILLDVNAKVGREDIFEPTIGNERSHEISNDNGVRLVNFATSKNLTVNSMMFPYRNIPKYTWTSPDGETHNQIDHILVDRRRHSNVLDVRSLRAADCDSDHILVDRRRHSNVLDVRSLRAADCDSDHYLVVGKVRERLVANKTKNTQISYGEVQSQEVK
jgi:hypothetical protein